MGAPSCLMNAFRFWKSQCAPSVVLSGFSFCTTMHVFDDGIAAAGDADEVFLVLNMSAMDGFSFGLVTSAGGDGENWEMSPSFFSSRCFFTRSLMSNLSRALTSMGIVLCTRVNNSSKHEI